MFSATSERYRPLLWCLWNIFVLFSICSFEARAYEGSSTSSGNNDLKFVAIVCEHRWLQNSHEIDFQKFICSFCVIATVHRWIHIPMIHTCIINGPVDMKHYPRKAYNNRTNREKIWESDTSIYCQPMDSIRQKICMSWAVSKNAVSWVFKVCWPDWCHQTIVWTAYHFHGNQLQSHPYQPILIT